MIEKTNQKINKTHESSSNLKLKIETSKPIIHNPNAGNSKNLKSVQT
jgi:hypothetical protein